MTATGRPPSPPMRRSRRPVWILLLWAAAALLVLVQYLHVEQVYAALRHASGDAHYEGDILLPSGRWRFWGIVTPLALVTAALILQFRWSSGAWRWLAGCGLVGMVPVWLLGWLLTATSGAHGFDSVRLADGRRYILAIEPILTDQVYGLYESVGPAGLYWRIAGDLDYSEDGRFTSNAALVLSPDEKWLLITRGGVWTDCFRVGAAHLVDCAVKPYPYWNDAQFEREMRLRSSRIAARTGLRPPGNGPDP